MKIATWNVNSIRARQGRLLDWLQRVQPDVLCQHHPEGGLYSWWDYRRLAFPKNDGLRLLMFRKAMLWHSGVSP